MTMRAHGALAIAVAATGCSVVLMEKPPDQVGEAYPVCTDSVSAPVADVAIAALSGLIAFGIWNDHQDSDQPIPDDERNAVIAFSALAAGHAASAALGAMWISKCSARRNEWEARHLRYAHPSDPQPSPTSLSPGPPPPRGGAGQPCYPNDTCNAGLTCNLDTHTCAVPPAAP